MTNYQKMYTLLFNAITDALAAIERQEWVLAQHILIRAQQKTEMMYIEAEEDEEL